MTEYLTQLWLLAQACVMSMLTLHKVVGSTAGNRATDRPERVYYDTIPVHLFHPTDSFESKL